MAMAGFRDTYSKGVGRVGQRLMLDPEEHTVRVLKGRTKGSGRTQRYIQ